MRARLRCTRAPGPTVDVECHNRMARLSLIPASGQVGMAAAPKNGAPDPSPGGDSLLFALRCSDRRRIGEVGAGRSHPRSRRRAASRAHQAGSLARVPPRPSLAGELYRCLRTGTAVARRKSGTMLARLMPMPRYAATGIPARRSTWRAVRPRVCAPAPPAPCGSRRAAPGAPPML